METGRQVAIYTRISLDRQGESLSPDRQEALCRQLAAGYGWDVEGVYGDRDRSGWRPGVKRAGFDQAWEAIEAGRANVLMAYSLSRIGRRARKLLELVDALNERGAALALYDQKVDTSTGAGRLFYTILAGFAELESEQISERVKSAHLVAAQSGKMHTGGGRQFGYTRDGEADEAEAEVVREVVARVLAGESWRQVALDLNARSIPTTSGGLWRADTLSRSIRSPRLAGLRVHGEDVHTGGWAALLTLDEHGRLQGRRGRTSEPHLLAGLVVCGRCGAVMRHQTHVQRSGNRTGRYQCRKQPGSAGCGRMDVSQAGLEAHVVDRLLSFLARGHLRPVDDGIDREAALRRAIEEDEQALVDLGLQRFVERSLSQVQFEAAQRALRERLEANEAELVAVSAQQQRSEQALRPGKRADLDAWWAAASPEDRRAALAAGVRSVVVNPAAGPGGPKFDPGRVQVSMSTDIYSRALGVISAGAKDHLATEDDQ